MIKNIKNNIIQNAGMKNTIQTLIILGINDCIFSMDKITIEKIINQINKDAIKKYKMPIAQTTATQTLAKNTNGGNNKKILKKDIVKLYNYYLLLQDQNNLSYLIKKKLDKKIAELKNLEGGSNDIFIKEFIKNLNSRYVNDFLLRNYIEENKILDYLKIYNIIDKKISNKDYLTFFNDNYISQIIMKNIIEYYFKLIMEIIDISNIINSIILENNESLITICPNKTIDDCFKSFLKNNIQLHSNKYKEIYKNKEEEIITIIIFILIYFFNIKNSIDINSFFNRTTIMNKISEKFNREQDEKIKIINNIFKNKNFKIEYNNFISKNELITKIISKENFNEKYDNLLKTIKAEKEAKKEAEKEAEKTSRKEEKIRKEAVKAREITAAKAELSKIFKLNNFL
jgi:hypothetical protein